MQKRWTDPGFLIRLSRTGLETPFCLFGVTETDTILSLCCICESVPSLGVPSGALICETGISAPPLPSWCGEQAKKHGGVLGGAGRGVASMLIRVAGHSCFYLMPLGSKRLLSATLVPEEALRFFF